MGQLGEVHPAGGAPDTVDIEQSDRGGAVEDLVVTVTPAEPQQVVAQRLGEKAVVAEFKNGNRAVAFRELGAVSTTDHRQVAEVRQIPAHGPKNLDLSKCVGQVVVAADDVGDRHVVVIDDHGMKVGRCAVAAQDDHVVKFSVGDANLTLDQVIDHGIARLRRLQPDRWGDSWRCFGRIPIAPAPVVARSPALSNGRFPHLAELVQGRVAAVGVAGGEQRLGNFGVAGDAGGLKHRRRVGREVEPGEAIENGLGRGLRGALAIGVLDAQQELAVVVAREQEVEQGGAGAADMQQAGRARGEAGADCHPGYLAFFGMG